MHLKKFVLTLTTVAVIFACAVPCYAETSNVDNFCISGISPLYELADTANAYLSISGTTASCQTKVTASDGVSSITVVQTLQKHWAFGIYSDVSGASWTKTVNGRTLTISGTKSGLDSGTYQVKSVITVTAKDGTSETFTVYSETKTI